MPAYIQGLNRSTNPIEGTHHGSCNVLWYGVIVCIVTILYSLGALLSQSRFLDQDEFLHLHAAWYIFKGFLPYRDYFDHYTPLFQFVLAPLFHLFEVENDFSEALASFFFARKLMWLTSGLLLFFTFWLGRSMRGTGVGLFAVLFLLCTEAYWHKTLEIRPDALATVFCLVSLITVVRVVQHDDNEEYVRKRMFACSGLFLALAFLTIQKVVYALPGMAIGAALYVFNPSDYGTRRRRLAHVASQLIGFCVPMLFTAGYFYLHDSLTAFIQYNFLFHLGAKGFSPYHGIHQVLYQHAFLGFFGIAGVLYSIRSILSQSSLRHGDFFVVPSTFTLLIGLFLIPVPQYQYYILFLPLVAIFAAAFVVESVPKLADLKDRLTVWQWISVAASISLAILVALAILGHHAGSHWPWYLFVGYWFGVLLVCMGLIFKRASAIAVLLFSIAMSVGPLKRLQNAVASPGTTPQLDEIRYIVENTAPSETIMDGYQGSGVYRPHAYFFWFLPYKEREGISETDKQQLLESLNDGSIAPTLILYDNHLRSISTPITEFFENNYEPVGTGVIWRRKIDGLEAADNVSYGQFAVGASIPRRHSDS
jgi:hypothetical protein